MKNKYCQKRRIKHDIPFVFDYEKYDVDTLRIFRQFFYSFYLSQNFDYDLIKKCVIKAGVKDIDVDSLKKLFNKWLEITN